MSIRYIKAAARISEASNIISILKAHDDPLSVL